MLSPSLASDAGQFRIARPSAGGLACAALLLIAFTLRCPTFGDPAYKLDEQFYLLVGDRILHGALPYVDIWDRKPIGLFLIYAGCRLLGGSGFVEYQLIATLFAAATAMCIFASTRRIAGASGAAVAGALYLLWLEVAEGGGGQSPVFYNLCVGAAAALLIGSPPGSYRLWRRRSLAAMLLIGLGIQIKYTVMFEGLFLGLVVAAGCFRLAPDRSDALRDTALLMMVALLPTLAVLGFYTVIGEVRAFWFANFTSVFLRGGTDPADLSYRTHMALLRLLPFSVCAAAAAWHLRRDARPEVRRWQWLMLGWMATSLAGFFALGVLYSHYLLPVFLPFAAAGAPIYRRWPTGPALAALAAWLPASHLDWPRDAATTRSQLQIASLAALVPADVTTRCMQMFDGPPALYYVSHACMVSRFVFPDHLSAEMERTAIGVDPVAELHRILAAAPRAITISDADVRPPNRRTFSVMRQALARDYRIAGRVGVDGRDIYVYLRR